MKITSNGATSETDFTTHFGCPVLSLTAMSPLAANTSLTNCSLADLGMPWMKTVSGSSTWSPPPPPPPPPRPERRRLNIESKQPQTKSRFQTNDLIESSTIYVHCLNKTTKSQLKRRKQNPRFQFPIDEFLSSTIMIWLTTTVKCAH